nr:MAG TPA: hypothetical protein [Caudoviricetes sp.]
MTDWPTAPLICIKRGLKIQEEIMDELAIRNTNGSYMTQKHALYSTGAYNAIDEWEDVTPVPTAALKHLRDVLLGVELPLTQFAAIQQVTSLLPADKPTPLDQAAAMVEDMGGPMISAETLPADRLSLILDALASVQDATRKAAPLAMFARICVDWANVEGKRSDSLEAARRKADALSISHDFIALSALVADVITAMDENFSPHRDLIDITAYALAWAARIIKEEE